MKDQTQVISFDNPWMGYYHMIPNIADDELSKDEYRLYGHYVRACQWVNQRECYESTRTTSQKCDISRDNLKIAREGLERKGYIKCEHPSSRVHSIKINILDVWGRNYGTYAPLPKLIEIFETLVERAKSDKSLMPTLQQLRIVLADKSSELAEDSSNVVDLSSTIGRNFDPKNKYKEKGIENRGGNEVASQMPTASSSSSSFIGEEISIQPPETCSEGNTDLSDPKTRRRLEQVIINNCRKNQGGLLKRQIEALNVPFNVIDRDGNDVAMPSLNELYDTDENYRLYVKETFDYYNQYGRIPLDRLINNLREVTRPGTGWLDWKEENSSALESRDETVNPTLFIHSTGWSSYYFIISVDADGKECYLQTDYLGNPVGEEPIYELPND